MRVEANPQDGLFSYLSPKRRVPSDHPESHNCYFQGLGAKRLLAKHSLGSDRYLPPEGEHRDWRRVWLLMRRPSD